jgi:hypothetical protein
MSGIGSAAGGSVNLSTSLSNVAKLAAHPKFVWVFNANCDGTIIYNDPVFLLSYILIFLWSINICVVVTLIFFWILLKEFYLLLITDRSLNLKSS